MWMRCVGDFDPASGVSAAPALPRTRLDHRGLVRVIPHMHHKPPVLRPLVDSDAEMEMLARFEGRTNQRLQAERQGLADLDPRELAYRGRATALQRYGETFVNAAFTHTRPGGNRFNSGDRGAWHCATTILTALHEVAFHRARELAATGWWHDEVVYKAYHCDLVGEFPDLRGVAHPALAPDPAVGYPAGQRLAAALREAGETGLIYPSARDPGGVCVVVFVPQAVQNVTPGAAWRLRWAGSEGYEVGEV